MQKKKKTTRVLQNCVNVFISYYTLTNTLMSLMAEVFNRDFTTPREYCGGPEIGLDLTLFLFF